MSDEQQPKLTNLFLQRLEFSDSVEYIIRTDFSNDWHTAVQVYSLEPSDVADALSRTAKLILRGQSEGELK